MELTVKSVAEFVGGKPKGDLSALILGAAGLSEASPTDVSFIRESDKPALIKEMENSKAGAVLVPNGFKSSNGKTVIEVPNPLAAFAAVLERLNEKPEFHAGIHPSAVVAASAVVDPTATVGPLCVVDEGAVIGPNVRLVGHVYIGKKTTIGDESLLYPFVCVRENVSVGKRCVVHPSAVIGSDGYGFYFAEGRHNKIPQIGRVLVEDDVEIGAGTTIDRATTGATVIHKGTKIDNLVQIAHNVEIGENTLLIAQVGIAGSCRIGKRVTLAGQVGVADHVRIGDGSQVGAQSGIKDDVPPGSVLFGSPAQPIQETIKQTLLIRRLPEVVKTIKLLKRKLGIE